MDHAIIDPSLSRLDRLLQVIVAELEVDNRLDFLDDHFPSLAFGTTGLGFTADQIPCSENVGAGVDLFDQDDFVGVAVGIVFNLHAYSIRAEPTSVNNFRSFFFSFFGA